MSRGVPLLTKRRWTDEELQILDWYWGEESEAATAERVGRTIAAVRAYLLRSRGTSAALRGRVSLAEAAREGEVSVAACRMAIAELGLRPLRLRRQRDGARCPHIALDEEQAERVVEAARANECRCRVTVHSIALDLGVHRKTAMLRARALGLDVSPWQPLDDAVARALLDALTIWGERYDQCARCGEAGASHWSQHWANGLCRRCWRAT